MTTESRQGDGRAVLLAPSFYCHPCAGRVAAWHLPSSGAEVLEGGEIRVGDEAEWKEAQGDVTVQPARD